MKQHAMSILHRFSTIVLSISFTVSASLAQAATTYFVDATSGVDTNSGTSQGAPWKTIAKVNSKTNFEAGDSILFKRGEVWRGSSLSPASSGSDGNPVSFGAYGETSSPLPRITAATLINNTNWVAESNGEYSIETPTYTTSRITFLEDGKRLTGKSANSLLPGPVPGSLQPGQWAWKDDGLSSPAYKVYYKPSSGTPSDHVVEIAYNYLYPLNVNNRAHLRFTELEFYGSWHYVAFITGNDITLENSSIHSGNRGVEAHYIAGNLYPGIGVYLRNNHVHDINWKGIGIMNGTRYSEVSGNHVHAIGKLDTDDGDIEGILIGGAGTQYRPSDALVENNHVENIGRDFYKGKDGTTSAGQMSSVGIVIDASNNVIVRNNTINNAWRIGMQIIASKASLEGLDVYGNVMYDIGHMTDNLYVSGLFFVASTQGFPINNVRVFNNTITNSTVFARGDHEGIVKLLAYNRDTNANAGSGINGFTFANNIISGITGSGSVDKTYAYVIQTRGTPLITDFKYENNLFNNITTGKGVFYLNSADPQRIYSVDHILGTTEGYFSFDFNEEHGSLSAAPSFKSATDFHLSSGSPATNAGSSTGTDVRSTDHDGVPIVGMPDIGAYENLDQEGDGVADANDNCPSISNPNQLDSNGNGIGDACDPVDVSVTLSASPDPVYLGSNITYTATVTNNSPSAASSVTVSGLLGCALSSSSIPSGGTVSCTVYVLADAVATTTQTVSVSGAEIDPNTSNNTASTTTQVVAPDLVPTDMSARISGSWVFVSDSVQNLGNGTAGVFSVSYYLSTNTTYESGIDLPLVTTSSNSVPCARTITSLAPRASSSDSKKRCYKPGNIVTGQRYYVLVVDDTTKQIIESNESNNVKATTAQVWW